MVVYLMAAKRYNQFVDIIKHVRPRTIVEIGTHRGARARLMVNEAMKYAEKVEYVGYDIFEHGGEAFQRAAFNGKGTATEAQARSALDYLSAIFGQRFRWDLVVGDTRDTLNNKQIKADLAFIDGDHRVETIKSDYHAVRSSKCVVLDDYYLDGGAEHPDKCSYGCNLLVEAIRGEKPPYEGRSVRILPEIDEFAVGKIQMAVVQWNP